MGSADTADVAEMKAVMFLLICLFPVVLGVIQYISWSQFTIRRKIVERHIIPEETIWFTIDVPLLLIFEKLHLETL